ncbi:hypothetical protein CMUS01_01276 [Colletotrichum musicola]|uniref:Uncharacterized protein n=1 Tax=Colletotrichum musicola TaxID=2175873 RepID=A0A8H6U8N1_9PEZI|nr:hypothetical protein CMUS01_01276 [Colletotrichum musicola]
MADATASWLDWTTSLKHVSPDLAQSSRAARSLVGVVTSGVCYVQQPDRGIKNGSASASASTIGSDSDSDIRKPSARAREKRLPQ